MPKLGKKKFAYTKEGYRKYIQALKKKRKKEEDDYPREAVTESPLGGWHG